MHILGVFSDSTAHALQLFADANLGFEGTAKFVKMISSIWKIMTVKTPYKGQLNNACFSKKVILIIRSEHKNIGTFYQFK